MNPLLDDRDVDFVLHEVLDTVALTTLPAFADHSRDTFDFVLDSARRLAREHLFPAYRTLDEEPPTFEDGRIRVHPVLHDLHRRMVDLGLVNAARPYDVGGQQVPMTVTIAAHAYLMAANLSAFGYVGLTTGAAHLIEEFGSDELRETFMAPMYEGRWTGTMALTEPQAGSSLGDLTTSATPADDGTFRIRGSKIFISGGDHDLTENVVHLVLARIDGAPAGTRGISLFAVPRERPEGDDLVPNDVAVAGMIHKIGWKGLPSLALNFGEQGDCHGWLVGEPGRGLAAMFQMMNGARLMVGLNGVATASVAYQESLAYARERTQGRAADGSSDGPVPIIDHADVRRMLVRQKAIVDGGFTLLAVTAHWADLAEHATDDDLKRRAGLLLDLLTPIAKTFPAERGFESNALAVQIHGGYGYSSEYLPEAWLRDQKLNSIHEGTTGIQSLDLMGRRAMAGGGAAIATFLDEVRGAIARAEAAGVRSELGAALEAAATTVAAVTAEVGARGADGDVAGMLRHSADYLDMFSVVAVAWQHLLRAAAAAERDEPDTAFVQGVAATTDYWFATEVPRVEVLAARIRSGEDSYARMQSDWF